MKLSTRILAAATLAVAAIALPAGASAQDASVPEITVTPSGPGGTGNYGAYGRNLPGVYLLNEDGALPTGASAAKGQVKLPGNDLITNRYTYNNVEVGSQLPRIDAWSGTAGPPLFQF